MLNIYYPIWSNVKAGKLVINDFDAEFRFIVSDMMLIKLTV
jgi:hypothetical protein